MLPWIGCGPVDITCSLEWEQQSQTFSSSTWDYIPLVVLLGIDPARGSFWHQLRLKMGRLMMMMISWCCSHLFALIIIMKLAVTTYLMSLCFIISCVFLCVVWSLYVNYADTNRYYSSHSNHSSRVVIVVVVRREWIGWVVRCLVVLLETLLSVQTISTTCGQCLHWDMIYSSLELSLAIPCWVCVV